MTHAILEKLNSFQSPQQWPQLAQTLREYHYNIEGDDTISIRSIIEDLIPDTAANDRTIEDEAAFQAARSYALITADMADQYSSEIGTDHYMPRHSDDAYHTYDHFREAVLDTIVLAHTYNKLIHNGAMQGEPISTTEMAVLAAAMALHDWQRGLGPSEIGYGMEIRAAETFCKLAQIHDLPENLIRIGVIAILSTSPFVSIDPAQSWFVAGQKVGNYKLLAERVDKSEILTAVEGLSEILREIQHPENQHYLFLGQVASMGDILSGTVLGEQHSIKNNYRVAKENAAVTGSSPPPHFDADGLPAAKAGQGFLNYLGPLPRWFNILTDNACPAMLERYRSWVHRLEPSMPSNSP